MLQTIKTFYPTGVLQYLISMLVLLFITSSNTYATDTARQSVSNPGPIVVTIKPLYSLVAYLTEGVSTPVLLMKQTQSPHHYNMRPSERSLLADARMIIWLGPQMESYLSKIIQQQDNAVVVTVLHADNLKLLSRRRKHSHDGHDDTSRIRPEPHMIDPHVWLSTHNAKVISELIAESLISSDPINAGSYKNNLRLLLDKIQHTKDFSDSLLKDKRQPFIAFHDAFQYFEEENGLNYIDSVSYDDETGASLKQLRQIMTEIDDYHIQCLVYQDPKPAIVDSLRRQTSITATAIDPLGLTIDNDKEAWFDIMRQLAVNFNQCLGS